MSHGRDSARYALAPLAKLGTKICQACQAEVPSNAVVSVTQADQMAKLRKHCAGRLDATWAALICGDCADLLKDDRAAVGTAIHEGLSGWGDGSGPPR